LTALGIASSSLDFLIASHVIEHIKDEQTALREVYRVLKPGASALLQVPMDLTMTKTIEFGCMNPNEYLHYRRYGLDYRIAWKQQGLKLR
jgi:ubiquinone/menaquinone biosynthesis C-methylase UbiE